MMENKHDGTTPHSEILLVEPFYCGSHKQLMDCLMRDPAIGHRADLVTMSGKKWHWRARTSSLHLSGVIRSNHSYRVLFTSSVLNLAELVALRPDLAALHKVLYFHENQLQYPVRKQQDRDFQYGYNQIISCLVADVVVFNSKYNMESFLSTINSFLKLMPDYRPKGLSDKIRPKCRVLYFPMLYNQISVNLKDKLNLDLPKDSERLDDIGDPASKRCRKDRDNQPENIEDEQKGEENYSMAGDLSSTSPHFHKKRNSGDAEVEPAELDSCASSIFKVASLTAADAEEEHTHISRPHLGGPDKHTLGTCDQVKPLHIVWPHRWEHDKDPQTFFDALFRLQAEGLPFLVSVLGETFTDVPEIFDKAKEALRHRTHSWGFQEDKSQYYWVLQEADVVVSTSKHEFFGVAMLEAVHLGCFPLCPRSLVYPEIYPENCLYSTPAQLYKRLREFCRRPHLARHASTKVDLQKYAWDTLRPTYLDLLLVKT